MIALLPEEREPMSQYIYSLCGVTLDSSKTYLIENRLGSLLEEAGCRSFSEFRARAQSDGGGKLNRRIVDAITTGETLFFRDTAPFELLRHKILPDLMDRRSRSGVPASMPIRIWSAACSSGQEVYSIAIVFRELLGNSPPLRLLGTDISDAAVAKASRGFFSAIEMARGLADGQRSKYFVPCAGEWKIQDEIRGMATFRNVNLLKDFSALGKFDIIFCRNVAIYFTDADRAAVFARIGRALDPQGYLIVGSMESLSGVAPQFESQRHLRSVFYQLKESARK